MCLKHFMCVFHHISTNSAANKMDTHNISVCVAPSIFHKSDRQALVDVESSFQTIAFVKHLIENCAQLFGDDTLTLLDAALSSGEAALNDINNMEPTHRQEIDENTAAASAALIAPMPIPSANVKQSSTLQKREFGRMLNLVSLKGRKSLAPKSTSATKGSLSSLSMDAKVLSTSSSNSSYSSTASVRHHLDQLTSSEASNDASQPAGGVARNTNEPMNITGKSENVLDSEKDFKKSLHYFSSISHYFLCVFVSP